MSSFVHLHVHTQYSVLEGALRIRPLFDQVKEFGMSAVAMTDTNNLFGAIDFYTAAKGVGVKPIIGCEVFYAPKGRQFEWVKKPGVQRNLEPRFFPLVLLCKNLKGYQNLCRILTQAYLEAPPVKKGQPAGPRELIDRDMLSKYKEGLIVLSGGLKSEVSYLILEDREEEARESIDWFKSEFGQDYYLELMDIQLPEQDAVNETLYQMGKNKGIEVVATSNCFYLDPKDAESQEVLQCIGTGRNLDFDRPQSLVPRDFYFKPAETMLKRFEKFPEACSNTLKIADQIDLEFKFQDEEGNPIYHLPDYRPDHVGRDQEFDLSKYFYEETRKGLENRFQEPLFLEKKNQPDWEEQKKVYYKRLQGEMDMIVRTGFPGYFMIVADFVNWAKSQGIPVGPGRGSGAGSLVAYSLRITDIDPIEFNLLFERFINPERISLPDFDIDFCQDRRAEVIDYVTRKYGADNVCQIITFGKLQARAAVKDVGRVLGFSFSDTDQITKLFPDELNIKIASAIEKEPRLKEKIEQDQRVAKVVDYALAVEGLYRNPGIHAAGVIITQHPVVSYCPLYAGKDGDVVTQFDKDFAEKIGLVKFDFLGLKTLTVIANAVRLVREMAEEGSVEADFMIEKISYKDSRVYELISSGDTDGVFQVESSGMKDLCTRLKPGSVEDLTAINALYRPGPLGSGMVDDFIDRKHGRKPIVYELDALESILKDTYGVILYQEQVMQIARELAGYSLGQADMLRRAMGKKKFDEMARHREIFLKGSGEKGIPAKKAEIIYDLMAKFAEYGFNKSHSAAYAVLTYQTAYLKTYYPSEFMAALMTTELNNTDKLSKYITDARSHGIQVLGPNVNASQKQFGVEKNNEKKAIRFGLEAIKGVGGIAVDSIIEARQEKPFENVFDFCQRVSTRKVNKKVLESLTLAGAFDEIAEVNRASLFVSLENLLEKAADEQEERALGQSSLFDSFSAEEIKLVTPVDVLFKPEKDWPLSKKLAQEKTVVGFYISGHPMDQWQHICENWLGWSTRKVKEYSAQQVDSGVSKPSSEGFQKGQWQRPKRKEAQLAGVISEMKEITTKRGSLMAFSQLEDLDGKLELIVFPEAYQKVQEILKLAAQEAEPVIISGELETKEDQPKIFVQQVQWLKDAHSNRIQTIVLKLDPEAITVEQLRSLKTSLLEHRGKYPVRIDFTSLSAGSQSKRGFKTRLALPSSIRGTASPQMVKSINQIFGAPVVEFT